MIVWNDRHISSLLFLRCGNDGNAMIKPFFPKTLSKTISDLIHGIKIIHFLKFALSRCPPPFLLFAGATTQRGWKAKSSPRLGNQAEYILLSSFLICLENYFLKDKNWEWFVREICATNCPCDKGGWFWHLFFSLSKLWTIFLRLGRMYSKT